MKKSTKKAPKKPEKSVVKKAVSEVKKTVKKAARKVVKAMTPEVKTTNGVSVTHTVAPPPPEIHAVHAEAIQAIENENKEFQAETKLAASDIVRQAWDEVRGDDPPFDDCVATHQDKLTFHAESILTGGVPMSGDTILARFEQAVARLRNS